MVDESDSDGDEFADKMYNGFPSGETEGFGTDQGYNTIIQLNDPALFTEEARNNPVISEFLAAPFSVSYVQLKSSHREAEWYIHKPHLAFAGQRETTGIEGRVARFPETNQHIGTYVMNHELTLAKSIMRALIIEDGAQAGQMIHKAVDPAE
jgi:hypothetical protein